MKKNLLKYFAAVFFITIYLLKGATTIVPVLFSVNSSNSIIALLMNEETDNNANNTEERFDSETRDLYLYNNYLVSVGLHGIAITPKNIAGNSVAFKQLFFASIPTPPPQRV